ncbi:MAG TPA: Crp/Fnr family transcriptional regulator [Chitinophagaceae bacterium]|nr:Crp/Fnr family transcriptional regulator [Chitinophagaceae bacterium]
MHDLLFKNISRFIDLTDDEKQYFISLLKVKKLRKKQYLLQEGDICRYECFVNKGCLRAYSIDEKGQEHIVQFAIEDWWIGDMYSFLTQTPARLTIDALEDAELFCIDNPSLENIFSRIPKFERFFRLLVQNAFIAGQRRIIDSMSLTADEQYCRFIENYPLMEQRLPLKQIASFLGITPESLSRIRSQYKKK